MRLDAGTIVGRKYRLERLIATGGMGAVWEARHEQLGVPVAVKLISSGLAADPAARARFEREARAAAQLRSPHVVQVLDYGVDDDLPYMAMEMLRGEDLAAHLARRGRLSLRRTARIVADVARAIALAHEAGIVHRDLKPRNVYLARVGDDEVIKVCDFGIAKELRPGEIAAREETATGTLLGSPHYMSPEQARGGRVDQRSDLWSMGVLAFEAITGRRPFVGENMGDVIVRICTDPVPVASKLVVGLPAEVDAFFARALSREPGERYGSARELAAALQAIAARTPEGEEPALPALGAPASHEAVTVEGRAAETAAMGAGPGADAGARPDASASPPHERSVAGRLDATHSLPGAASSDTLHAAVLAQEAELAAQRRARRGKSIARVAGSALLAVPLIALLWQRVVTERAPSAEAGAAATAAAPDGVTAPPPAPAATATATATAKATAGEVAPGKADSAGAGASSASAPPPTSTVATSATTTAAPAVAGKGASGPGRGGARPAGAPATKPSFDPFSGLPVNKPVATSRPKD